MSDVSQKFEAFLNRFVPQEDLQSTSSVIYGIVPEYELAYFNAGWRQFAENNSGEPAISDQWGLGRCVLDAIPGSLRLFYKDLYDRCRQSAFSPREPLQHNFECPSPTQYRLFTMTLYHVEEIDGVLVVNSLRISRPHSEAEIVTQDRLEKEYLQPDGCFEQCLCCRKVKHATEDGRWDFVAEWVDSIPRRMSSGLCGFCVHHYYKSLKLSPPIYIKGSDPI